MSPFLAVCYTDDTVMISSKLLDNQLAWTTTSDRSMNAGLHQTVKSEDIEDRNSPELSS